MTNPVKVFKYVLLDLYLQHCLPRSLQYTAQGIQHMRQMQVHLSTLGKGRLLSLEKIVLVLSDKGANKSPGRTVPNV